MWGNGKQIVSLLKQIVSLLQQILAALTPKKVASLRVTIDPPTKQ